MSKKWAHEFTIERKTWARGDHKDAHAANSLLNRDGTMCCLGFFLSSCGVKNDDLASVGAPGELDQMGHANETSAFLWGPGIYRNYSRAAQQLIKLNDKPHKAKDRERAIKRIFSENNIKVNFVP